VDDGEGRRIGEAISVMFLRFCFIIHFSLKKGEGLC
jgi:hypothetical protein